MTALIVALLVAGAALLVAEAHVVSYGVLGSAGLAALVGAIALSVTAAGGSAVLAIALAAPVALAVGAFGVVAAGKALAARRRRALGGADGLIGRIGVMRHGDVVVRGERWAARR